MPPNPTIESIKAQIFNPVIILLFVVALTVFLWGVFEFMAGQGNEEKVSAGKKHMIWGIIGLGVMVSAFGILNVITCTVVGC